MPEFWTAISPRLGKILGKGINEAVAFDTTIEALPLTQDARDVVRDKMLHIACELEASTQQSANILLLQMQSGIELDKAVLVIDLIIGEYNLLEQILGTLNNDN